MNHEPNRGDREGPAWTDTPPAVMAVCSPHDAALWAAHPDVEKMALSPVAGGDDVTLYVWLKAVASGADLEGPRFEERPPERPFDLEVGGDGEPHPAFWARCPHLEHLQMMVDPAEGWWGARLWLAEPFRRPEVGAYATPIPFRTDDFALCVRDEVERLVEDFGPKHGPVDYLALAKSTERELDHPDGSHLDPDDPVYWRAVASELYRRHCQSSSAVS